MLIPFALVVALLIATAVIAPLADNLGKKLGKKRVSVFGLRPRTTATLATIGSGWAIMIVTLAILLSFVAPLRNALFHYESERARLDKKAQDAEGKAYAAEGRAQIAEGRTQKAEERAQTADSRTQKAEKQNRQFQKQTQDFQEKAQTAQRNFQNASRGEQDAKRGAQVAQRTAKIAQVSARNAQNAAAIVFAQQKIAQKTLTKTQSSLRDTQNLLQRNQDDLQKAQSRLTLAKSRLDTANKQLVSSYKSLTDSYKKVFQAQQQLTQAKKEVSAVQAQKAELQAQVISLNQLVHRYDKFAEQLAFGDISLPVDQTLAERRFDATRSPEEIARELHILVGAARIAKDQFIKGAALVVKAAIADKSGTPIELNEDQAIELYSNALSAANQTVSARLVSAFNYPSDTTIVAVRFVFIPIRTIYIARENITVGTIDSNKSEAAIFGQLQKLVDDARYNAVKRGSSPPLSPDDKNFFDGDTGPKMFDALREIQKFDHPVPVRVVAARDLDSAESLQIRFIVGDET